MLTDQPTTAPLARPDPRIRLTQRWGLWPWVFLRSAGFPGARILALADPEGAAAADRLLAAEAEVRRRCAAALAAARERLGRLDPAARTPVQKLIRKLKRGRCPRTVGASDPHLAAFRTALDELQTVRERLAEVLAQAELRLGRELSTLAGEERFRRAVAWQNLRALRTGVEVYLRQVDGGRQRNEQMRQKELLILSYLQRYCTKNDTIGFFGPMGWARLLPEGEAITVRCGERLVAESSVFFEHWAIEALARELVADPALRPWLAPWQLPFFYLEGEVYHPFAAPPRRLCPAELAVFQACDGERMAVDIARLLAADPSLGLSSLEAVYLRLEDLAARGMIAWSLEVPWTLEPERALRRQLQRVGDEAVRSAHLARLDELEACRLRAARAKGVEDLSRAMAELERRFVAFTGRAATRLPGQLYAGRTLVYQDCRRAVEVELGPQLTAALGPPLELVLASARWLSHTLAESYRQKFRAIHAGLCARLGTGRVPLIYFFHGARTLLFHRPGANPVADELRALQEGWSRALDLPADRRRVDYATADLAPRIRATFDAPGPGWTSARMHSVDLMIGAESAEAIRQGRYQLVLGELHPAGHFMFSSMVRHHPWREEFLAALAADFPEPRVVFLPARVEEGESANPLGISALPGRLDIGPIRDHDLVVRLTADPPEGGRRTATLGDLLVTERGHELVVVSRDGEHCFEIVEFCDMVLTGLISSHFQLLPPRAHIPRITLDRLVIQRETWRIGLDPGMGLAGARTDAERFVEARRWARGHDLPRFVFVRPPAEGKPYFMDFDSPLCALLLAKLARDALRRDPAAVMVVSEMLPDLGHLWLPDGEGRRYTSELRLVALDLGDRFACG